MNSEDTHLYLGRQKRLKVTIVRRPEVRLGNGIEVIVPEKSQVEKVLKQLYRERAMLKFEEVSRPLIEKFRRYSPLTLKLYLKEMPTRWGSCTFTGKIILNPELVKAPRGCIEYVVLHELTAANGRSDRRRNGNIQALQVRFRGDIYDCITHAQRRADPDP